MEKYQRKRKPNVDWLSVMWGLLSDTSKVKTLELIFNQFIVDIQIYSAIVLNTKLYILLYVWCIPINFRCNQHHKIIFVESSLMGYYTSACRIPACLSSIWSIQLFLSWPAVWLQLILIFRVNQYLLNSCSKSALQSPVDSKLWIPSVQTF